MEVRDYKLGDELEIIQLFKLVFNQEMSLDRWRWRFVDNPAGKHFIKLMWDKNKLIGHYAVSPVLMEIDNVQILGAQSLTTMTHPDYGRRGIFKKLSIDLYQELEYKKGVKIIWGFPNNNSHYGFIKTLGWQNIGIIHSLVADVNRFTPTQHKEINEIHRFNISHQELFRQALPLKKVRLAKNVAYLNWRFVARPSVKYRIFELKIGDVCGVLVTKLYPSETKGYWELNIIELVLVNWDNLEIMINHVLSEYKESIDMVTIWKNLFDDNHLILERQGFIPTIPQTYLGARVGEKYSLMVGNLRNWDYAMGDSDIY